MTDKEAYALIWTRAEELSKEASVRLKMMQIAEKENKEAAIKFVYMLAIATLSGL